MAKAPGKRQKSPPHFFVRKDPSSHTELTAEKGEDEMALPAKNRSRRSALRDCPAGCSLLWKLSPGTQGPESEPDLPALDEEGLQ